MNSSFERRIFYTIATASIVIPLLIARWYPKFGGCLFLGGVLIAYRVTRILTYEHKKNLENLNNETKQYFHHAQNERGRTILVQIVDDLGQELPETKVQKLLAEAQANASPKDAVIGVRFKIPKDNIDNSPSKRTG